MLGQVKRGDKEGFHEHRIILLTHGQKTEENSLILDIEIEIKQPLYVYS